MALFRIATPNGRVLAAGDPTTGPERMLGAAAELDRLLAGGADHLARFADGDGHAPVGESSLLTPLQNQEIWAAGVTYLRSRIARGVESVSSDPYDRVYDAQRPELFMKCGPGRVRGSEQPICIRRDSGWDVPEPELTVIFDALGEVAAYAIGNDVSSRSIEGENTLYLPQAKTYTGSCAIGPCLVLPHELEDPMDLGIRLRVHRHGVLVTEDATRTSSMHRTIEDLGRWLFAANDFPLGVALMTGTGIVPPEEFSLQAEDRVEIDIDGLGTLSNTVVAVGAPFADPGDCWTATDGSSQ